jgi:hypothetical protein
MTRLMVIAVPFFMLAGVVPAAPVPPGAGKQFYFPTRVGTKWVYAEESGAGHGEIVTESEEKNGRFLVTVKATSVDFKDGPSTTVFRYDVSHDGVFMVAEGLESSATRLVYDRPVCLLKLPHKVGEEWGGDPKEKRAPFMSGKVESVKVPAGTFEAIRVDSGKDYSAWYASGIGCIKFRLKDYCIEMKSFSLPKE